MRPLPNIPFVCRLTPCMLLDRTKSDIGHRTFEDCTKSTLCVCLLVRAQGQPALHNPIQETLELERPKEATSRQVHVPCPFCSDESSSTPDGGAAPAARRRRRATKVGRKVERSGKWWSRLGYRGPACEALPFHTFAPPHLSGVFVWI